MNTERLTQLRPPSSRSAAPSRRAASARSASPAPSAAPSPALFARARASRWAPLPVILSGTNVGNAIGVGIIGVIFFGALNQGFASAFELSLAALAAILLSVAALTRLLPAAVRS